MGKQHSANIRYLNLQIEAWARAQEEIGPRLGLPDGFSISHLNTKAEYEWRRQWQPISDRTPPHGGWDWSKLNWDYRNDPGALKLSFWVNNDLLGLCLGRLNKTAVRIDYLEAAPISNHSLRGKLLPLAIETGAMYAQGTGRKELWLMDPVPAVIEYSRRYYGFEYLEPQGSTPFCRIEV